MANQRFRGLWFPLTTQSLAAGRYQSLELATELPV